MLLGFDREKKKIVYDGYEECSWIHIHFIRHFEKGIDTIELFFIVAIVFSRCRTLPGF